MSERESSDHIVSDAQLYGWRRRVREIDSEIESLSLEKNKLQRLVEMAEMLASEARQLAAATDSSSAHPKFLHETLERLERTDPFPKAVLAIVERFEDGASYDDIREAILQSPLAPKYRKSDKGFYHALARLKDRGELLDHNGFVFTPSNLEIFRRKVTAGLKSDKVRESEDKKTSPLYDLILEVIAHEPGHIAKDVITRIKARGGQGLALTENENSAYNAVARLRKRGVLEGFGRNERHLRIGPNAPEEYKRIASSGVVVPIAKRTEAPSGRAVGASEVGPLFGVAPPK